MTRSKHLKKAIRDRAAKTGERYAAARRQVLLAREKEAGRAPAPAAATPPEPGERPKAAVLARGLGLSESAVLQKTGHGYAHWFAVLDTFGRDRGHTAFARHLRVDHGLPGWHAQGITVAYERARGLRAVNQASTGGFQVSVSRALPVPFPRVVDALADAAQRRQWLRGADASLRKALEAAFRGPKAKSVDVKRPGRARLRYRWDTRVVEVSIDGKKDGGATVAVATTKLKDHAAVEPCRAMWKAALDSLKVYLLP
jgi:uncharacterized protein YndB with AHSA1/START domain